MDFIQVGYVRGAEHVSLSPMWLERLMNNLSRPEPEMENYKFAIVGILGDSNSGKSFLMNALAEYLRREEKNDHKWIDNEQVKNLPGFALHERRNLNDNFFEGIYMWPRPFILKKPCDDNYEESIAILLLDINMNKISPGLEVLMSLLCTTLIYNKTSAECPDISRILKIRSEILKFKEPWGKLHPEDIVFRHLMVVFRDSKQKCGKDKSLNYLSGVMNMEQNIQWKEELKKMPSKSCFILKPPFENGNLEFDKTFISQLKVLAKDMLTVDDLPLKTLKNVAMSLKAFMSDTVFMDMFIPQIVTAFTKVPYQETNFDHAMEVDETETPRSVPNGDEDIKTEIEIEDHEMEDLSETSEELTHKNLPTLPVVHLQKTKLEEQVCIELSKNFPNNSIPKPDENQNPKRTHVAFNKDEICSDFERRIENILLDVEKQLESNLFSESKQCKPIEEIIDNIRAKAIIKVENLFEEHKVSTPSERLRHTEQRLDAIINGKKKIWLTQNSEKRNTNTASHIDLPISAENLRNDSEITSEYSNYVAEALKKYSKRMVDFLSSGEHTNENAKQFYDELAAAIITEVHTNWVGKVTVDDDANDEILRKLEESCKSDVDRYERIQNAVEKTWKCFDKSFAKECTNFVKSGDFIRKEVNSVFDDLLIKSLPLTLPYYDKQDVIIKVKNLPETRKCIQRLKNVQTSMKKFASEMKRNFQLYNFFEEEQFGKILQETELKITKDQNLDDVEIKVYNSVLPVIKNECKTINRNIIKNEKAILENTLISRIKNVYNEEMKLLTQKRVVPKELKLAHENLKKECTEAVKRACNYNDRNYRQLNAAFTKLGNALEKEFEFHKDNNEMKIQKSMTKVNLMVKKAHGNYISLMESKTSQKIMSQREIEQSHKESLAEASVVLKKELGSLDVDEDSKIHIKNLELQTKHNFEFFVEENQKRTRAEEEKKELEKREKLKQEALEKRKVVKERRDTHGKSNGNADTPIQKPVSPVPERSTTRHLNMDNFSRDKASNSKTIAIEFGMKTVKCGIVMDGKLTIIPDQWGHEEFPNIIAITNEDEILIGHEVSALRQSEYKFVCQMVNIFFAPLDELPHQMISFCGRDVLIQKELLCGLILSRIKSDAETFLNASVDSIVLTVPLCYNSSQRKAAKDAAIIGGFSTVHLITEPTAVALAYAQHSSRINSNNHFLVVVADSDYAILDIAVYHYTKGKVKMVKCAGYLHHDVPNFAKKCLKEATNKLKNILLGESEKEVVHSYLKQCVEHKDIKEFSLVSQEGQVKSNILKMVNELCKDARPATQPNGDVAILMGAAIFAELRNDKEKGSKPYTSDLLPYRFECLKEEAYSPSTKTIFSRQESLPVTERPQSFPFDSSQCLKYRIYETGNVIDFFTGDLVVPITSPAGHKRKGAINFFINSEGIFRVSANYTNPKEDILIKYFPINMSEEKIAENASSVALIIAPNPRLAEERRLFNDSKSELRILAESMIASLHEVQSVFGKDQMEKRAAAALEALGHPKISLEDVSNRIAVLTKLKSKYLK